MKQYIYSFNHYENENFKNYNKEDLFHVNQNEINVFIEKTRKILQTQPHSIYDTTCNMQESWIAINTHQIKNLYRIAFLKCWHYTECIVTSTKTSIRAALSSNSNTIYTFKILNKNDFIFSRLKYGF